MSTKSLTTHQILPLTMAEAWDFFSSPRNLNEITPNDMTFVITSNVPEKMYEGLMITYKVSPFLKIPMNWVTEITHIREPFYFVDEQRIGPYRMWHHEHHFREVPGGVEMTDILHYNVGMGFIGRLASWLFVDRKVKSIFAFREQKLKEMFPEKA